MSFYIQLEFNKDNYPNNNESNFTTIIDSPLYLEGAYEVALTEITYTNNWSVNLGKIKIDSIEHDVIVNDKLSVDDLKDHFSKVFKMNLEFNLHPRIISYSNLKNTMLINKLIDFDINLCSFFNIKKTNSSKNFSFSSRINPNFQIVKYLNIFCDIIDDQIINNTKAKLIKTIKVEGQLFDTIHKSFDLLYYFNVNKTFINTINIKITDQFLKELNFNQDKIRNSVIIKLHFRKKKDEFLHYTTKRRLHEYFSK